MQVDLHAIQRAHKQERRTYSTIGRKTGGGGGKNFVPPVCTGLLGSHAHNSFLSTVGASMVVLCACAGAFAAGIPVALMPAPLVNFLLPSWRTLLILAPKLGASDAACVCCRVSKGSKCAETSP